MTTTHHLNATAFAEWVCETEQSAQAVRLTLAQPGVEGQLKIFGMLEDIVASLTEMRNALVTAGQSGAVAHPAGSGSWARSTDRIAARQALESFRQTILRIREVHGFVGRMLDERRGRIEALAVGYENLGSRAALGARETAARREYGESVDGEA